jgi:hypothetical protein
MNIEQLKIQAEEARQKLGATGSRRMGGESLDQRVGPTMQIPHPGDDLTDSQKEFKHLAESDPTLSEMFGVDYKPPVEKKASMPQGDVIKMLLAAPELIRQAQTLYDETDHLYRNKLAELSIKALSEPMFPGKKPEDGQRMASNEEERSLAVQSVCSSDVAFIRLAQNREAAGRSLHYERNQFEAAKLVAGLLQNGMN